MSNQGVEFLNRWIEEHVTERIRKSVESDAASLSVEMAERLIADAEKAGWALDDLEPEFGAPEVLIREALEADEGTLGD
ncbi:MAG TPA: hypothetical protein VM144_09830 [Aestuariivirga sp.]|nr:hypothetical protein [Aestuariivirga sp.]